MLPVLLLLPAILPATAQQTPQTTLSGVVTDAETG